MRSDATQAAARWRLALPRHRLAGRIGSRAGRGLGSSIEFEDHRAYQPGDDPRHVDWRAYARTDRIEVRLYREEVAPLLDVVVDTSASMGTTPGKLEALHALVAASAVWAGAGGGTSRVLEAGGGVLDPMVPLAVGGPQRALPPLVPLRRNGLRLVVSDFLFPRDPRAELTRIAAGAAHVFVVHLLDPWEVEPETSGTITLVDVEDDERVDLALDATAVAAYRARLTRLERELADAVRVVGGTVALARAGDPAGMFADLGRQGILEPA